jgi:hypothetical protein
VKRNPSAVVTNGEGNPPAAPVMGQAELIACLRDVHRYWSTPQISPSEMAELERRHLIQRAPTGLCAIRLTEDGALVKDGRKAAPAETLKETYARTPNARTLSN